MFFVKNNFTFAKINFTLILQKIMENLDTKGKRLSYLINSKIINLSKSQLADLIGISPTLLSFYINDGRNIKDEHLKEIYKHFPKVNAEWLELGIEPVLHQISKSQSGNLFDFDDVNNYQTDNYTPEMPPKTAQNFSENRNFEQKSEKNIPEQTIITENVIEKIIEKVVEGITEKQTDKKIKQILIFYDNGTFEELRF